MAQGVATSIHNMDLPQTAFLDQDQQKPQLDSISGHPESFPTLPRGFDHEGRNHYAPLMLRIVFRVLMLAVAGTTAPTILAASRPGALLLQLPGMDRTALSLVLASRECATPQQPSLIGHPCSSVIRRLWVFDVSFRMSSPLATGSGCNFANASSNQDRSHRSNLGLFGTAYSYIVGNGSTWRSDPGFRGRGHIIARSALHRFRVRVAACRAMVVRLLPRIRSDSHTRISGLPSERNRSAPGKPVFLLEASITSILRLADFHRAGSTQLKIGSSPEPWPTPGVAVFDA